MLLSIAVFGGVFVSGLALGEERRAGLAGKKIIKTVEQFTSERRTAD
jgi:hypothetical protein